MSNKLSLIVDSGATKAEWQVIAPEGKNFLSAGLQPYLQTQEQMLNTLQKEVCNNLDAAAVENVHYYGAGCSMQTQAKKIVQVLGQVFPNAVVNVWSDMLGAARALCGGNAGLACTLGTGSNALYYDGEKIITARPGLGYVLGDEGSGAMLGKAVIQHFLYDIFEDDLKNDFNKKFNANKENILLNVYQKPNVSRYLAGFCYLLVENRNHHQVEKIIKKELQNFFDTHLTKMKEAKTTPISFTGSVAFYFQDIIKLLCEEHGYTLGKIIKNPMDGLIEYHK